MADHGYGKYSHGCRCTVCRGAKREYVRAQREARYQQRVIDPATGRTIAPITDHGLVAYNEHGCRCRECRSAKSAAHHVTEARRV